MKILVTGATSFVGKHLCNNLIKLFPSYEILGTCNHTPGIDNEEIDERVVLRYGPLKQIHNVISIFRPDFVYHLAGITKPNFAQNPAILWDTNVMGTIALLNEINCPIVFTSTSNIETDSYDTVPVDFPTTHYAASKLAAENILYNYLNAGKIPYAECIRFCGIVGHGVKHGLIYDMVNKLKSDSKELSLGPNVVKPYLYIDDVIMALSLSLIYYNARITKGIDYLVRTMEPWNAVSAKDVAEIGMEVLGIKKPIVFNDALTYPGNILNKQPCNNYGESYDFDTTTHFLPQKRMCPYSQDAIRKAFESYV